MPFNKVPNQSFRWLVAELLVVVLGILIAFQIDEWNTYRQERQQEIFALEALFRDLENNERDYLTYIDHLEVTNSNLIEILEMLQSDKVFSAEEIEEASILGAEWLLRMTDTAFNSIQNTYGLGVILDTELQSLIVEYFSDYAPYIIELRLGLSARRQELLAAINKDFNLVPDEDFVNNQISTFELRITPEDWPSDPNYANLVIRLVGNSSFVIERVELGLERISELKSRINEYLN